MEPHPFRTAVAERDRGAIRALLAEDVEFRSPAVHRPYRGRAAVTHLLVQSAASLRDLTYLDELRGDHSTALVFRARVGARWIEGATHLEFDQEGRIVRLRVMVRPLSGLVSLAQMVGARLDNTPIPND